MIAQGTFREDLFYRLNVIHLDRAAAARAPRRHPARWSSTSCRTLHAAATAHVAARGRSRAGSDRRCCAQYSWPGNVRELENVIERLVVTGRARDRFGVEDLPPEIRAPPRRVAARPQRERRRTVADDLYQEAGRGARVVLDGRLSALHAARDHARQRARPRAQGARRGARQLQDRGCGCSTWSRRDYKRFLNFLRKHDCQLAVQRVSAVARPDSDQCPEAILRAAERPFDLVPNPRFLYLTPRHREALSNLRYGSDGQRGASRCSSATPAPARRRSCSRRWRTSIATAWSACS